jgi:two-component system cell cycle response regulator
MSSSRNWKVATEGKDLRYKLLVIEALIFVLPFLILSYIFYKTNVNLNFSQIIILCLTLILILAALIILRQIFDKFTAMATIIKKSEGGETYLMEVQKDTAELHEITVSFNSLMKGLEKTTVDLKRRVFELFAIKELTEVASKSLNIDDLLNLLLEKAMLVCNAQIGSVYVLELEKERFRVATIKGLETGDKKNSHIRIDESLARLVVYNKKPLIVEDIETDPRTQKRNDPKYGPPSFLSMPISVRENLLAVLNLAHKTTQQVFDSNDEQILSIMIGEIGFALENAQLHSRIEEHSKKLQERTIELSNANKEILGQQQSVIEEERVKILLQMAGATAHELHEPLGELLANVERIELNQVEPEKLTSCTAEIQKAGKRIANIVRKIQTIHYYDAIPHTENISHANLDKDIHILSVEKSDHDFHTIEAVLKEIGEMTLSRASNVGEGLKTLEQRKFDLVLLGDPPPNENHLDFFKMLNKEGMEIPVIVITGTGNEIIASQVIQAGAYDYMPKTMISGKSVFRSIAKTLEKARLMRDMNLAQKKMAKMSTMDELTGLYNRRYFMEALEREVASDERHKSGLVVCMIDLDKFKEINDTYGHFAGDMVLSEIGKILRESFRKSDLVCRYGGDEFGVILGSSHLEGARVVCERLREAVAAHQFEYRKSQFHITLSVGIVQHSNSVALSPPELVSRADEALYQAKERGRNRVLTSPSSP